MLTIRALGSARALPTPFATNPRSGERKFHAGQDFKAPAGTPIPSAANGKVVYSGFNELFGNVVIIRNDAGGYSLYAHMQEGERAELGQRVWKGDTLGLVGSTGKSTGPHLHYAVIKDEAGTVIENSSDPRDGGAIGIALNKGNTINPAEYSNYYAAPRYLDETGRLTGASPLDRPPAQEAPSDVPLNFNDRYSAIYSPATTHLGDERGIGGLLDIAKNYGKGSGVGTSPMLAPWNGRTNERQRLLDDRSGYGSPSPADDMDRFRSPVWREIGKYRQLAAGAPAPRLEVFPRAANGTGNGATDGLGGIFKWIETGLVPSAHELPSQLPQDGSIAPDISDEREASASEINPAPLSPAQDNRRYLTGRIAGRPFAFQTGVATASPITSGAPVAFDRPESFDDRFGSWSSSPSGARPVLLQQSSRPLGLVSGQPIPDRPVLPPIFERPDRRSDGLIDNREPSTSRGTGIPLPEEYIRYLNREYLSSAQNG